jgi:hypothetical protein
MLQEKYPGPDFNWPIGCSFLKGQEKTVNKNEIDTDE